MERRQFLRIGRAGLLLAAAPAIVRAEALMPVRPVMGWDVPRVLRWIESEQSHGWQTGIGLAVEYRGGVYRNGVMVDMSLLLPEQRLVLNPRDRADAKRVLDQWRCDLPAILAAQ